MRSGTLKMEIEKAKDELQEAMMKLYAIEAITSDRRERGESVDDRLMTKFSLAYDRYRLAERTFSELREQASKLKSKMSVGW